MLLISESEENGGCSNSSSGHCVIWLPPFGTDKGSHDPTCSNVLSILFNCHVLFNCHIMLKIVYCQALCGDCQQINVYPGLRFLCASDPFRYYALNSSDTATLTQQDFRNITVDFASLPCPLCLRSPGFSGHLSVLALLLTRERTVPPLQVLQSQAGLSGRSQEDRGKQRQLQGQVPRIVIVGHLSWKIIGFGLKK